MKINANKDGPLFTVIIYDGLKNHIFEVHAHDKQEALDRVADYLVDTDSDLCADYYELFDCCEDETVAEYAQKNGLTCCGTHGVYVAVVSVQKESEGSV